MEEGGIAVEASTSTAPVCQIRTLPAPALEFVLPAPPLRVERDDSAVHCTWYFAGLRLGLVHMALGAIMFLVPFTFLSTSAITPTLSVTFHSTSALSWYASTFLISTCILCGVSPRMHVYAHRRGRAKEALLGCLALFMAGCAVSSAAYTLRTFVAGRIITGLGAATLISGCSAMLQSITLQPQHPLYRATYVPAVYAIAAIAGPLIGSAFSSHVSWRWCFYFNLMIGGVAALVLHFALGDALQAQSDVVGERYWLVDGASFSFFAGGAVCFLLAIQWGGLEHPWRSGIIISLFILAAFFILVFIALQIILPNGEMALELASQDYFMSRSFLTSFSVGASAGVSIFYLPIWLQTAKDFTVIQCSVRLLPLIFAAILAAGCTGFLVSKTGKHVLILMAGIAFMTIGAGLFTILDSTSPTAHWASFEFLYGLGLGTTLQYQRSSSLKKSPLAINAYRSRLSAQLLGGALFITIAHNVFTHALLKGIAGVDFVLLKVTSLESLAHIPGIDAHILRAALATSLRSAFRVGLAASCLSVVGTCLEIQSLVTLSEDEQLGGGDGDGTAGESVTQLAARRTMGPGTLTRVGGILQQRAATE
ncbi:hypothetical protein Cpir12675_006552 [Ceratocystis pirilliformis]|uniref:Major facilitator superfamily (MFS) profile domain-containing protein n=1 Tax=Ceratocystis pirilliformis TaxID=259994 RepID=A0ABR3YGH3_9PEZI